MVFIIKANGTTIGVLSVPFIASGSLVIFSMRNKNNNSSGVSQQGVQRNNKNNNNNNNNNNNFTGQQKASVAAQRDNIVNNNNSSGASQQTNTFRKGHEVRADQADRNEKVNYLKEQLKSGFLTQSIISDLNNSDTIKNKNLNSLNNRYIF